MRKNETNRTSVTRKSVFVIALLSLMTIGTATAQIFLDDESLFLDSRLGGMDTIGNIIPFHEVDWDQANYVPASGGIMMLGLLGGAYLLNKKRKKED